MSTKRSTNFHQVKKESCTYQEFAPCLIYMYIPIYHYCKSFINWSKLIEQYWNDMAEYLPPPPQKRKKKKIIFHTKKRHSHTEICWGLFGKKGDYSVNCKTIKTYVIKISITTFISTNYIKTCSYQIIISIILKFCRLIHFHHMHKWKSYIFCCWNFRYWPNMQDFGL